MNKLSAVRCVHCGGANELRLTKEHLKGTMTCRSCRREFPAFEAAVAALANPVAASANEAAVAVRRTDRPRIHRVAGYSPLK